MCVTLLIFSIIYLKKYFYKQCSRYSWKESNHNKSVTVVRCRVHTAQLYTAVYTHHTCTPSCTHSKLYAAVYTQHNCMPPCTRSTIVRRRVHTSHLYAAVYIQHNCMPLCTHAARLHKVSSHSDVADCDQPINKHDIMRKLNSSRLKKCHRTVCRCVEDNIPFE